MTMATYMNGHSGQMLPVEIAENGTFFAKEKHCRQPTFLSEKGRWYNFTMYTFLKRIKVFLKIEIVDKFYVNKNLF